MRKVQRENSCFLSFSEQQTSDDAQSFETPEKLAKKEIVGETI